MDYPVPSFGVDSTILSSFQSLAAAEKQRKHKWDFVFLPTPINPAKKTMYDFNEPLDEDVRDSATNLKNTEEALGQKMVIWDEEPAYLE
jgi:hypothetical protein